MNTIKASYGYCLLVALILGFYAFPIFVRAGQAKLDLRDDFRWTEGELRSEISVKREIPACVGITRGKDMEFKS